MYEHKDLAGITRIATVVLWVFMSLSALFGLSELYIHILSPQPDGGPLASGTAILALVNLIVMIVTFVVVGRWIYRASVNAHATGAEMTITPGWAVGWYFVPIANLFKPFQAMKEIWLASHYQPLYETAPPLLSAWWALWIVSNVLGNISFRLSADQASLAAMLDFADGILHVVLSLLLMTIMKQVMAGQDLARRSAIFA